jgi:peptidoglycan/LPS O-acetylase OafA/YrhL
VPTSPTVWRLPAPGIARAVRGLFAMSSVAPASADKLDQPKAGAGSAEAVSLVELSPAPTTRLAWLDALRGIAALCVVVRHLGQYVMADVISPIFPRFDPGLYGVMVFFLVSGYIVPASLERRGSVRGFWVGRVFRLYPLCLVAIIVGLLASRLGLTAVFEPVSGALTANPVTTSLANISMLQQFLGVPGAIPLMWTLSYEMAFYLLLTALFIFGLHRRSAELASGLAAGAILIGTAIPLAVLPGSVFGIRKLVILAVGAMAAGLVAAMSRHRALKLAGAVVLSGLALGLVLINGRDSGWYSMIILGTMFAGTALYRAEQGQISWRRAGVLLGAVLLVAVYAGTWHDRDFDNPFSIAWSWSFSIIAAWATFGLGMLYLRHRRMPRVLTWLGAISYSVYLMHLVILSVMLWLMTKVGALDAPLYVQAVWAIGFLLVVVGVSHLTYRLVELPGQQAGRRFGKLIDQRWGRGKPDGAVKADRPAPAAS